MNEPQTSGLNELMFARLFKRFSSNNRSLLQDALLAVLLTGVGVIVRLMVAPAEEGAPYVFFFPSVLIAALLGGLRTGFLATLLSLVFADYFFIPPYYAFSFDIFSSAPWRSLTFLFDGVMLSIAIQAMHRYRHHYQEKLRQSESLVSQLQIAEAENLKHTQQLQNFAAIIESTEDAIISKSPEGIIKSWNPGAQKIFGYTADEVIGKSILILFSADRIHKEVEIVARILRGEHISHFETVRKRKDDKLIDISVSMSPIYDQQGKIVAVSKIARDVTRQRQAETELLATNLKVASLLDSMAEGAYGVDLDGVCTFVNRSFLRMLGFERSEQVVGSNIHKLIHHTHADGSRYPAKECKMYSAYRDGHGVHVTDEVFWRKDGTAIPVEYWAQPIVVGGAVQGAVATFVDITDRIRFIDELRASAHELIQANARIDHERAHLADRVMERTAELQLANHAKDSFLATMSHEIRTPLGGLLGMMELLAHSPLNHEQDEILKAARQSGNSLLRIVNDILDWSKIEAGKLEIAPRVCNLADMLTNVVNTYSQIASERDIRLKVCIDPRLKTAHVADSFRVTQILNNFTSNAIKYTDHGTVEISARSVSCTAENEEVCFSVKDSGIGIPPELQARLFRQYEQASAETARMYGGTGLGLAICRRLAELMGGALSVASEPGEGSTFSFTVSLPIVQGSTQDRVYGSNAQRDPDAITPYIRPLNSVGSPLNILIADDHPLNRMLLKQQLAMLGAQVEVAAEGAEALAKYQTLPFDLIISDCHMPEMDGYELSHRIRQLEQESGSKRIPIIAWTANVLAEEVGRCHAAGMNDLMTKPTELADLREMLEKWLTKEITVPASE